MSYQAIAGALALTDVTAGERLVALALASWANREHRSYPGTRLAVARAGMSKRKFEDARDALAQRGLIVVESKGGGRGHKAIVRLLFAETGPWCDYELNAPLLEAVLSHSRLDGSARVLLAALAACADANGVVDGLSTNELREVAGLPDRTYRRARAALLVSGEASVASAGGGRAKLNVWLVHDPRASGTPPLRATTERATARPGVRPLMASARSLPGTATTGHASEPSPETVAAANGNGADLTVVSVVKGADLAGVPVAKGADLTGVPVVNGADLTGVSRKTPAQTPAETPAQTPAPNARTGRESLNPLNSPPGPPGGGNGQIQFVEEFITDRGRRRQRPVTVNLDDVPVRLPTAADRHVWQRARSELELVVGAEEFAVHLGAIQLAGSSPDGELLLECPPPLTVWLGKRYGRLFARVGDALGVGLRLATKQELQILSAVLAAQSSSPDVSLDHQEAV